MISKPLRSTKFFYFHAFSCTYQKCFLYTNSSLLTILNSACLISFTICSFSFPLSFPFFFLGAATTLTSWHLMVTFCTLHAAQRLNFFESKSVDTKTVMLFGILNGVSIGLLNLSLGFNSIGFYQVDFNFYI